jgi:hypothetical protein
VTPVEEVHALVARQSDANKGKIRSSTDSSEPARSPTGQAVGGTEKIFEFGMPQKIR